MKRSEKILLSGLFFLSFFPAIASAQSLAGYSNLTSFSILAGEYVTTGAGSTVSGNVGVFTYIATGASSSGISSNFAGSYITTGANSTGIGSNFAVSYITPGAGSTVIGSNFPNLPITDPNITKISTGLIELASAQSALNATPAGTPLAASMSGTQTLSTGVYNATELTTVAGTTLTLDAGFQSNPYWLFNIDTFLSTGANTSVNIANLASGGTASVIWNTGTFASLGASNSFVGSILAGGYISTGVTTTSGPLFAKGYVSLGADGTINSMVVAPIPEPEIYALMLAGIGLLTLKVRRDKKNQQPVAAA
jgi:hypothetical protein